TLHVLLQELALLTELMFDTNIVHFDIVFCKSSFSFQLPWLLILSWLSLSSSFLKDCRYTCTNFNDF
uniref:Uncharacterized protein n=1 Tax=Amphimedon queenslandica TaxID=400682 RepID=A0A1X7T4H1_AMPQE